MSIFNDESLWIIYLTSIEFGLLFCYDSTMHVDKCIKTCIKLFLSGDVDIAVGIHFF